MRALFALKKGRDAVIELMESGSPFGIEGQGDRGAISISPLPSFDRQQSHVRMGLDLGFGHAVVPSKGQ